MVACGKRLGEVLAAPLLYWATSGNIDSVKSAQLGLTKINQRMDNLDWVEREYIPLVYLFIYFPPV